MRPPRRRRRAELHARRPPECREKVSAPNWPDARPSHRRPRRTLRARALQCPIGGISYSSRCISTRNTAGSARCNDRPKQRWSPPGYCAKAGAARSKGGAGRRSGRRSCPALCQIAAQHYHPLPLHLAPRRSPMPPHCAADHELDLGRPAREQPGFGGSHHPGAEPPRGGAPARPRDNRPSRDGRRRRTMTLAASRPRRAGSGWPKSSLRRKGGNRRRDRSRGG